MDLERLDFCAEPGHGCVEQCATALRPVAISVLQTERVRGEEQPHPM